jgi:tetratricopeptide (TPR) repeat protein
LSTLQAIIDQSGNPVVDAERPWPGLFSYTEQQRQYFNGREVEIDELFRRVKRDTITVLYSKSGLGKSSLLQAGLFPRLRKGPFLPVYIRLKYDESAGPLESQMKSALKDAIDKAVFAEVASPSPDESLWEYLHHRGGNLIDRNGNVVCPVLVLDQFEEIFTLGVSTETARKLREQFLVCFADLAENSKPKKLSERLADNSKLAAQFDFSSIGCKFVVSLRDEYVTSLDDLRQMPSLSSASSRMRLKELDGLQALDVVSTPNPDLLEPGVPELIVHFVARDTENRPLNELEVAPAILSLFCRELSLKPRSDRSITSDLVRGNADTIIDDFYKRYVDNKPVAVHRLIEEELVVSGYRDNMDFADAKRKLEQAGVPASVLDELVNDRVLHIEDFKGNPRLELTHDVLLEPVIRRRELRREQEARAKREADERAALSAAKEAQELAKARFLQKVTAAACLAVLLLSVMFVYASHQRKNAQKAEKRAEYNAAIARHNQVTAETASKEALDSAAKAREAGKDAIASAEAEKTAEAKLEKAMQQVQAEKVEAERKSKQLAEVSTAFLATCDDIGNAFRKVAEDEADTDVAEVFYELHEKVVGRCIERAAALHQLDPANVDVTSWLGRVRLEMADSAASRKDKDAARNDCKAALAIADSFGKEKNYKTQIVAARTYAKAGYYLLLLHDPEAVRSGEKGVTLVVALQANGGATHFDAWDWDKLSNVYYYRGRMFEESKEYKDAIHFYQQAFDAESRADAKEPDESSLQFEMVLAEHLSNDARELTENDLANAWHQKYLVLAYDHVDQEETYSAALETLTKHKDYPAARVLIDRRIAFLTNDQKTLAHKGQLADAYEDSSLLSEKMKDWPQSVGDGQKAVTILFAARDATTDPEAQKKLTTTVAIAYGNLAWHELEAGRFQAALEDARKGLREDPAQKWIAVNEAHALLFAGQVPEAKKMYLALKDASDKDHDYVGDIHTDFLKLCEGNIKSPDMAGIAKDLGINDAKLDSCLASPSTSK